MPSMISCKHLGTAVRFGYEYQSPASRMPISPPTNRCMLSILHALQDMHTPLVFGDRQSGKSSTVQELARVSSYSMLANHGTVVVMNVHAMTKSLNTLVAKHCRERFGRRWWTSTSLMNYIAAAYFSTESLCLIWFAGDAP